MTELHPEPPGASVPVEVSAKAVRSEAIRAARIIIDRAKSADAGEAFKSSPRVQLGSQKN